MQPRGRRPCWRRPSTESKSIPDLARARRAVGCAKAPLSDAQKAWVEAQGFKGAGRKHLLLPGADGGSPAWCSDSGEARAQRSHGPGGAGARPAASRCCRPVSIIWRSTIEDAELAAVAWGLGAYRFRRYKTGNGNGGERSRS